jgi:hypothetical protein
MMQIKKQVDLSKTIRRREPSGSPGWSDIFGCQQYPRLLDIEVSVG